MLLGLICPHLLDGQVKEEEMAIKLSSFYYGQIVKGLENIYGGDNVTIDDTDTKNPIINVSGISGGSDFEWVYTSSLSVNASAGHGYLCESTGSAITIDLPTGEDRSEGDVIVVGDAIGTASWSDIIIDSNGGGIGGDLGDGYIYTLQNDYEVVELVWLDSQWRLTNHVNASSTGSESSSGGWPLGTHMINASSETNLTLDLSSYNKFFIYGVSSTLDIDFDTVGNVPDGTTIDIVIESNTETVNFPFNQGWTSYWIASNYPPHDLSTGGLCMYRFSFLTGPDVVLCQFYDNFDEYIGGGGE